MGSCEYEEVDLGFPKSITFKNNGGEKTLTSNDFFVFAEIQDYKGNHGSVEGGEDGKLYNVYDWLRVEYVGGSGDRFLCLLPSLSFNGLRCTTSL